MRFVAWRVVRHALGLQAALVLAGATVVAHAGGDLSEAKARALMFPAATSFDEQPRDVVQGWRQGLADDPDLHFSGSRIKVWRVGGAQGDLGWFVTDHVVGKFEYVDYAVALSPGATVLRVEVLKYREKHGYEVRERAWLAQFEGKGAAAPLRLGRDIDGISGATLSAAHLADGVRRVTRLLAAGIRSGAGR